MDCNMDFIIPKVLDFIKNCMELFIFINHHKHDHYLYNVIIN